jgi:dTDP-4-amino-4,6-dideoxygalactose transaminase
MKKYKYTGWPFEKIKVEYRRPEPYMIRTRGYKWDNPRDIVDIFEKKVADFFGAKYAIAVDCCSHAIFLSLEYLKFNKEIIYDQITIPSRTYLSVPMQIIHAGFRVRFEDYEWQGYYKLKPTRVIDAAVTWKRDAYIPGSLMCISFQLKKMIPIGRTGVVLTDDRDAYDWLKIASYDGRDLTTDYNNETIIDHIKMAGWHYYATPEDCARGIILMDSIEDEGYYMGSGDYPDISRCKLF